MFDGMIAETPFDLRWRLFGIDVRVHPLFWLVTVALAWPYLDRGFLHLLIWVVCVFVSIYIHELGHVVVGRWYGSHGHIVLWAGGGLAFGSTQISNRWKRIAVCAAGPGAEFILFAAILFWMPFIPRAEKGGYIITLFFIPDSIAGPYNEYMATFLAAMLWINFYWALVNLLPIYPLDGGQITRELFTHFQPRNGVRASLQVSIGVAGLIALHAFLAQHNPEKSIPFLPVGSGSAIFFALFAVFGVQLYMAETQRDYWTDDHRYN